VRELPHVDNFQFDSFVVSMAPAFLKLRCKNHAERARKACKKSQDRFAMRRNPDTGAALEFYGITSFETFRRHRRS
jgi:hypothetical protein